MQLGELGWHTKPGRTGRKWIALNRNRSRNRKNRAYFNKMYPLAKKRYYDTTKAARLDPKNKLLLTRLASSRKAWFAMQAEYAVFVKQEQQAKKNPTINRPKVGVNYSQGCSFSKKMPPSGYRYKYGPNCTRFLVKSSFARQRSCKTGQIKINGACTWPPKPAAGRCPSGFTLVRPGPRAYCKLSSTIYRGPPSKKITAFLRNRNIPMPASTITREAVTYPTPAPPPVMNAPAPPPLVEQSPAFIPSPVKKDYLTRKIKALKTMNRPVQPGQTRERAPVAGFDVQKWLPLIAAGGAAIIMIKMG